MILFLFLERKYPNLCSLCGLPSKCSTQDKYWGRRGPLYCLTDGIGDVSWARLDDVRSHFGLSSNTSVTDKKDYSLLCPNGEIVPLNSTNLCIWVVKPWPVIGSKRYKYAFQLKWCCCKFMILLLERLLKMYRTSSKI